MLSQILVSIQRTGSAALKVGSRLYCSIATGPKCFTSSWQWSWDLLRPLPGNQDIELACWYSNILYDSLHLIKWFFALLCTGLDVAHHLSDEKANNSPHCERQSALHFLYSFIELNSSCYLLFMCSLLCVRFHMHQKGNVHSKVVLLGLPI